MIKHDNSKSLDVADETGLTGKAMTENDTLMVTASATTGTDADKGNV